MTYSTFIHSGLVNPSKPNLKNNKTQDDFVVLDTTLLAKLLELANKNIKTDSELSSLIEKITELKNKPLTLDDYTYISEGSKGKEKDPELESILKLAGIQ